MSVIISMLRGNVVSRADKRDLTTACTRIEKGIERSFGFRPSVIVRTVPELREVIVRNPYAKRSGIDASKLLVAFLASSPAADALDKVLKIKCEPQELRVSGRELFIYFPDGMARPTLPLATVERALKISFTGRNWNTVRKLLEMAEALEAAGEGSAAPPAGGGGREKGSFTRSRGFRMKALRSGSGRNRAQR